MNCKPGDMALVIRGRNAGKMVTCVRLDATPFPCFHYSHIWRVDRDMRWVNILGDVLLIPFAPDAVLMPIRPGDSCSDPGYEMREGELVCKGCGESAREILEHA